MAGEPERAGGSADAARPGALDLYPSEISGPGQTGSFLDQNRGFHSQNPDKIQVITAVTPGAKPGSHTIEKVNHAPA